MPNLPEEDVPIQRAGLVFENFGAAYDREGLDYDESA